MGEWMYSSTILHLIGWRWIVSFMPLLRNPRAYSSVGDPEGLSERYGKQRNILPETGQLGQYSDYATGWTSAVRFQE
jgi:hypothetical protein